MMRRTRQSVALWHIRAGVALLSLGSYGCGGSLTAAPPGPSMSEGMIVEAGQEVSAFAFHRADQLLLVWVKEGVDDCGTVFVVTAETVIRVSEPGGSVERGTVEDLAEGKQVRVWVMSPVEFSCPAIGRASWILVLR